MVTESIQIPAELNEAIETAAEQAGLAKHELMLEFLQRGLQPSGEREHESHEPEPAGWRLEDLESLGIGEDAELSGANVKDWLRNNWRPS